jgi:hypothetical protein
MILLYVIVYKYFTAGICNRLIKFKTNIYFQAAYLYLFFKRKYIWLLNQKK